MKRASEVMNRIHGLVKKAPPTMERLRINDAVDEVIALMRSEMLKHDVVVHRAFGRALPDVEGDRVALQQVILNLLMNAVEAMSAADDGPREMTVGTSQAPSGGVLVSVGDSGPGLIDGDAEHLFEPFYSSKASGMGMGLAICRAIVETHGGRLWASANRPRGAVFQFVVPAGEGDATG